MTALKKLYRALTRFEELACSVFFLALVVLIVFDVIRRKFIGSGLPWLSEFSAFVFTGTTLIAGSVAVTDDEHPRMNAVMIALKDKAKYLCLVTDTLCCLFFALMFVLALRSTVNMYRFGTAYTNLPLKLWHAYIFFPLSFGGIFVRHVFRIIFWFKNGGAAKSGEETG